MNDPRKPMMFSFPNLLAYGAEVSPLIIASYILFSSATRLEVNGFAWFFASLVAVIIAHITKITFGKNRKIKDMFKSQLPPCSIIRDPLQIYSGAKSGPSPQVTWLVFTITYLLLSVLNSKTTKFEQSGWPFLMIATILAISNIALRLIRKCETIPDTLMGLLIGVPIGVIAFFTLLNIDNGKYLLFNEENDRNKKCEKKDMKGKLKKFICKKPNP
tara:strand:+ start:419 stop:1066 length:648 start_codon:yes stop_codon:yes gene_type:complete